MFLVKSVEFYTDRAPKPYSSQKGRNNARGPAPALGSLQLQQADLRVLGFRVLGFRVQGLGFRV